LVILSAGEGTNPIVLTALSAVTMVRFSHPTFWIPGHSGAGSAQE